MLKKKIKTILSTLLILSVIAIIVIESSSITLVSRSVEYIDDYNEFYLYKKKYIPILAFDFGNGGIGSGYKIWILPKQKEKLLAKIKEDVEEELTDAIINNKDILKSYKINDNFKKIYIYYYVNNIKANPELHERFFVIQQELFHTITLKVELYYDFINADGNNKFPVGIIDFDGVDLP